MLAATKNIDGYRYKVNRLACDGSRLSGNQTATRRVAFPSDDRGCFGTIFDAGDDIDLAAALPTRFVQALRPAHGCAPFGGHWRVIRYVICFTPLLLNQLRAVRQSVRCARHGQSLPVGSQRSVENTSMTKATNTSRTTSPRR